MWISNEKLMLKQVTYLKAINKKTTKNIYQNVAEQLYKLNSKYTV